MMTVAKKFAEAAESCVGAQFRLQGRDPAIGLDCVGLIAWCAKATGLQVTHIPAYTLTSTPVALVPALLHAGFSPRYSSVPHVGDVMVFDMGNCLNHAGVCLGAHMVHADMRFRRVVAHRIDDVWASRIADIYFLDIA
jgi:cell wall-associated NlpC family hydrolase